MKNQSLIAAASALIRRKGAAPGMWVGCLMILVLSGCGGSQKFVAPQPIPDDRTPVAEPAYRSINIPGDLIKKQMFDQISQSFDFARQARNLSGNLREAINVNAFDEVPNSSWFTNRNHVRPLSIEEIHRGPNRAPLGPDTSGIWTIVSVKTEGVTPGVNFVDPLGERYVLKFEPRGYSEMTSGAEVVSTKLFYAAGYHVPENYIVNFNPKILKIKDGLEYVDGDVRRRPFTEDDLRQEVMKRVEVQANGKIRAAASKFLEAKAFLGPFKYKGRRSDDQNDFIPHEHRRELRGLRVIASWLNHYDTKDNNTLDVFTHEGYVRHYLIDFGSTLGSQGDEPMPPYIGHENAFDLHHIGVNWLTLGLYVRSWEKSGPVKYKSIGHFTSDIFHPEKYKFILPNPAFELMTDRDAFWGAKIVASFSNAQILAAVEEGQYSDPAAKKYLYQTIVERRDIIARYWFGKINPLDDFQITRRADGQFLLSFGDLAIENAVASVKDSQYRAVLNETQVLDFTAPNTVILGEPDQSEQHCVSIAVRRGSGDWLKPVRVYLEWDAAQQKIVIVGLRR